VRLLIISDVHSNLEALEACLAAAPPYDLVVNLGDVVGYGASPNEVIERVRALDAIHIRGNHDKACAGLTSVEAFNPFAQYSTYWTRDALTFENKRWLAALPQGPLCVDGAAGVQFSHGSPLDEDEYVIGSADAIHLLPVLKVPVTFIGHTHVQGGFVLRPNAVPERILLAARQDGTTFPLERDTYYILNPGSVGQPRDGDPRAAFALFNTDDLTITYFRTRYDIARAQRRIIDSELPEKLASRLAVGR